MLEFIIGVILGAICQVATRAFLARKDRKLFTRPELKGILLPTPDDPRWRPNHAGGDVYELGGGVAEGESTIQVYVNSNAVKIYTRLKNNTPDWTTIGEWPRYVQTVKRHVMSQKALAAIEKQ